MQEQSVLTIGPQPGPQTQFLSSSADIVIYGGSAGGGKTFGLLIEPLRWKHVKDFAAVMFRRTTVQLKNPGGLLDEATKLYPLSGGRLNHTPQPQFKFPTESKIRFSHLQHLDTHLDWQGAQVPLLGFDELTHFTAEQFWYMLSRNRSLCGVQPYVRCTTNPDADSWVADLIEWWIDQDTGYAIPERSGVIRWFVRVGDTIMWGDSPEELTEHKDDKGNPIPAKSLTFIAASLDDNPALMEADPQYRANLMALGTVERERLLHGNWKIRPRAGLYFQRGWVTVVDEVPHGMKIVRGWDLAASTPRPGYTDPDWTCGTKIGRTPDGRYFVLHHSYGRMSPEGVENLVYNTAVQDGKQVEISIPQDPGQAGVTQKAALAKKLAGFNVRFKPVTGDKTTRFSPFSAQCEAGNVFVVRGPWNERWLTELENFPPPKGSGHDDDADSTSEAFSRHIRPTARPSVSRYMMR